MSSANINLTNLTVVVNWTFLTMNELKIKTRNVNPSPDYRRSTQKHNNRLLRSQKTQ